MLYSPFLAKTHAAQLVDISLLHFRQELPQARADRELADHRAWQESRHIVCSKPESERTRKDKRVLGAPLSILGSSFNMFDWDDLGVDENSGEYFPASPLREPFHALFESAPAEALRLIKELSNHAMTAWRQLHRFDPQRRGTPIPLELDFPWGKQQFWGTGREYLWARGLWAPKPLAGGYQAMESWALHQLDAGRSVDAVIEDIVRGTSPSRPSESPVAITLKSRTVTDVTLPLFTSQRVWKYDLYRKVQEGTIASSSMIGFHRPSDRIHAEAVQALNALDFRHYWIRDYLLLLLLTAGETRVKCAREVMETFATNLPFEYEEEKANPDIIAELAKEGKFNAEFAKPENLKTAPHADDDLREVVYMDNPLAREPEVKEMLAAGIKHQQIHLSVVLGRQVAHRNGIGR